MIELLTFKIDKDLTRLITWIDTPRLNIVWATNKFTFPLKESQLKNYFELAESNGIVVFKINDIETKNIIGHCELEVCSKAVKICRLLIAKKYRSRGFGEETIKEVLKFIETNIKPDLTYLTVFSFNPAIKLYKRMGFEETKVEKSFLQFENENWNRITMELKSN